MKIRSLTLKADKRMSKFPLPYLKKLRPQPLPGLTPLRLPRNNASASARGPQEEIIANRAREKFSKWLPGGEWWGKNVEEACADRDFLELFKEALTISIKITDERRIKTWCRRLFGTNVPPPSWDCITKRGKKNNITEVCFIPILQPQMSAISPCSRHIITRYQSTLLQDYKLIAIHPDLMTLHKRHPHIAQQTANLLRSIAEHIDSPRKIRKNSKLHQSAMISILYSWWAKRGGSDKKFGFLASYLGITNENNPGSETFAQEARERLSAETFTALQMTGNFNNSLKLLIKFLKM